MDKDVLGFISRFTNDGKRFQVIDCFTKGCCYWFAYILLVRFWSEPYRAEMVYDQVENHFGCRIGGRVYDITGDVTRRYVWRPWDKVKANDAALANSVFRNCVNFIE